MLLTTEEQEKFAAYLEQCAASNEALAGQMGDLNLPSDLARMYKVKAAAELMVAKDLRSVTLETIG